MAKIQIYLPVENEKIGEPVIKVSELRELLEEIRNEIAQDVILSYFSKDAKIEEIDKLLAAIGTEGK